MLAVAEGLEEGPAWLTDARAMSDVATSLNERHSSAKEAERASVALYSLCYFRGREEVQTAYATDVRPNGLSVLVPRYGLEGWVHTMPIDGSPPTLLWNEDERALAASASALKIQPLDQVTVRISVDTSRLHPRLSMELMDEASGMPLHDVLTEQQAAASTAAAAAAA